MEQMQVRETAQTENNIIPRNNNVLIKMSFMESVMNISSGTPPAKDNGEEVTFQVAGIGILCPNDLSMGDKVIMQLQPYENVDVEGNQHSIKALQAFYRTLKPSELNALIRDPKSAKVKVVQYGLFPEFMVKAIISPYPLIPDKKEKVVSLRERITGDNENQ
jgi:hypothetical protein